MYQKGHLRDYNTFKFTYILNTSLQMEGKIKWFKREKGYGFVTGSDGKDYFVHYSALPQDMEDVRESDNMEVTFEVKDTDRGTQATDIKFTKDDSSSEDDSDKE